MTLENSHLSGGDDALAALERFIVENDDLLALEERIGRFNIFDALGIARTEIRHSNFLAWLLDPNESHGQGALFLNAVLMDLLKQTAPQLRPLSPIELDGVELRGVEIRREWKNIDLLIICNEPAFVITIENKVDAGLYNDWSRYEEAVRSNFPGVSAVFVLLTKDGENIEDEDWTPYSYADLHRVLTRCRRVNVGAIGDDVGTFLDHYLNLIGSRFMDDPRIEELCQRIYKNHRQAIGLILERVLPARAEAVQAVVESLASDSRWEILNKTGQVLQLWPVNWDGLLPPIGIKQKYHASKWVFLQINIGRRRCFSLLRIAPTKDEGLRREIIARLAADPKEFGLKSLFKSVDKLGSNWATLGRQPVLDWPEGEKPDAEQLIVAVRENLEKRYPKLAIVPEALRIIINQWNHQHA